MPKKELRIVVAGQPRPDIDPEAVVRIIIAFSRELAQKERARTGGAGGEA
jgi:hypothetical protein